MVWFVVHLNNYERGWNVNSYIFTLLCRPTSSNGLRNQPTMPREQLYWATAITPSMELACTLVASVKRSNVTLPPRAYLRPSLVPPVTTVYPYPDFWARPTTATTYVWPTPWLAISSNKKRSFDKLMDPLQVELQSFSTDRCPGG